MILSAKCNNLPRLTSLPPLYVQSILHVVDAVILPPLENLDVADLLASEAPPALQGLPSADDGASPEGGGAYLQMASLQWQSSFVLFSQIQDGSGTSDLFYHSCQCFIAQVLNICFNFPVGCVKGIQHYVL